MAVTAKMTGIERTMFIESSLPPTLPSECDGEVNNRFDTRGKRRFPLSKALVEFINRVEVVKGAIDWLDRYLGPLAFKPI